MKYMKCEEGADFKIKIKIESITYWLIRDQSVGPGMHVFRRPGLFEGVVQRGHGLKE